MSCKYRSHTSYDCLLLISICCTPCLSCKKLNEVLKRCFAKINRPLKFRPRTHTSKEPTKVLKCWYHGCQSITCVISKELYDHLDDISIIRKFFPILSNVFFLPLIKSFNQVWDSILYLYYYFLKWLCWRDVWVSWWLVFRRKGQWRLVWIQH